MDRGSPFYGTGKCINVKDLMLCKRHREWSRLCNAFVFRGPPGKSFPGKVSLSPGDAPYNMTEINHFHARPSSIPPKTLLLDGVFQHPCDGLESCGGSHGMIHRLRPSCCHFTLLLPWTFDGVTSVLYDPTMRPLVSDCKLLEGILCSLLENSVDLHSTVGAFGVGRGRS